MSQTMRSQRAGLLVAAAALMGAGAPGSPPPEVLPRERAPRGRPAKVQNETLYNGATRWVNPARRAKKATGLRGRQWKKYKKLGQRLGRVSETVSAGA